MYDDDLLRTQKGNPALEKVQKVVADKEDDNR